MASIVAPALFLPLGRRVPSCVARTRCVEKPTCRILHIPYVIMAFYGELHHSACPPLVWSTAPCIALVSHWSEWSCDGLFLLIEKLSAASLLCSSVMAVLFWGCQLDWVGNMQIFYVTIMEARQDDFCLESGVTVESHWYDRHGNQKMKRIIQKSYYPNYIAPIRHWLVKEQKMYEKRITQNRINEIPL